MNYYNIHITNINKKMHHYGEINVAEIRALFFLLEQSLALSLNFTSTLNIVSSHERFLIY